MTVGLNARDLIQYLDKHGFLRIDGLEVLVKVTNVKTAYGKVRLFIHPVGGYGEVWVDSDRVRMAE